MPDSPTIAATKSPSKNPGHGSTTAQQGNRTASGMAEIDRLDEDCNLDRWMDRFEIAAKFFNWSAANKAHVLLLRITPQLYDKLADYLAPGKPGQKSFADLQKALQDILLPRTYVLAERFTFQNIRRESNETIRAFGERLLKAAEKCDFLNKDERLRDQFICGLNNQVIIGKLIVKDHNQLTFKEATIEAEAHASLLETQIMKAAPQADSGAVLKIAMRKQRSTDKSKSVSESHSQSCQKCGGIHAKRQCPAFGKACKKCGKSNHFAKVCRSSEQKQRHSTTTNSSVQYVGKTADVFMTETQDCCSQQHSRDPITITAKVLEGGEEHPVRCELDTGAGVSIMSEAVWNQLGKPNLKHSTTKLGGYANNHTFTVLGRYEAIVDISGSFRQINFEVVKGSKSYALLGRDVLCVHLEDNQVVGEVTKTTASVKAHLELQEGAKPRYVRARPLPFAQQDVVKGEIDRLVRENIVEPVRFSEWASPIVIVTKPKGGIRLCVDYKRTLNPQLVQDSYPVPTPEEAFSSVAGCTRYSILDLEKAYNQIELDEASKPLTVMSTPFGNYQYNRLLFGIKTAPSIFQRYISQVIQGSQDP